MCTSALSPARATRTLAAESYAYSPCIDRKGEPIVDHSDYAARAVHADDKAELAVSPESAVGWHKLADTYRALAQQRAMMNRHLPTYEASPPAAV
jgi:hypothetical protein